MALVVKDRVRETTTTAGTGTVTLAGAVVGFQSFSVIGNANTTYYTITDSTDWEVGIGTYTASGTTLSRDTVLESSNAGALVPFAAGSKDVFVTYPAEKSISDGYGTLPVTNGGTGTTTQFTAGSVVFAGVSGVYAEDNANLFWDDTNNRLGIGTTAPTVMLDIFSTTAATASIRGVSSAALTIARSSNNIGNPVLTLRKSRGTPTVPLAVASGDVMGGVTFSAYGGTTDRSLAYVRGWVETYVSDTDISSYLTFGTTPAGTTTSAERMRITGAGFVGIGTTAPSQKLTVSGGAQFDTGYGSSYTKIGSAAIGTGFDGLEMQGYYSTYGDSGIWGAYVDNGGGFTFGCKAASSTKISASASQLYLDSGTLFFRDAAGTEAARITGGNLLVGNTTGTTRLHVTASGNDDTAVFDYGSGSATVKLLGNAASQQNIRFGDSVSYRGALTYDNATNFFAINTNSAERLRIDSSGNVGIGTSSPSRTFSVLSNGLVSTQLATSTSSSYADIVDGSAVTMRLGSFGGVIGIAEAATTIPTVALVSGNVGIGASSPGSKLHVVGASNGNTALFEYGGGSAALTLKGNAASPQFLYFGDNVSHRGWVSYDNASNFMQFVVNSNEQFRISSAGNLLVGNTTGTSKITATGVIESTTGGFKFPDGTTQTTAVTPLALWDYWTEAQASASNMFPWIAQLLSSGTINTAPPTATMKGYNTFGTFMRSSTTANSGARYYTINNLVYFGISALKFRAQFTPATAFTNNTIRTGFLDTASSADATDGAYFEMDGAGVVSAKTAAAGTRTTSGTTYALTIDTPYTFDVEVNAAGTSARFRIYEGQTATAVYDQTITTNIPTTTGNATGSGLVATNSGTTASDICVVHSLAQGTPAGYNRARG